VAQVVEHLPSKLKADFRPHKIKKKNDSEHFYTFHISDTFIPLISYS
jgi:hypothetical protein